MTPQEQLLLGLVLAISGNAIVQLLRLMKSPKEVSGELANQIAGLREDQQEAAQQSARHDEILKHLIRAIERLTERIDRMEAAPKQPGTRHRGG